MFPTTTERTVAVTTDVEAGAVLIAGPAAAAQGEADGLVLAASAGVLGLTSTATEVLAVLGVLIWGVALVVLVVIDVSRAAHRRHMHQHGRKRQGRLTHHQWGARR